MKNHLGFVIENVNIYTQATCYRLDVFQLYLKSRWAKSWATARLHVNLGLLKLTLIFWIQVTQMLNKTQLIKKHCKQN